MSSSRVMLIDALGLAYRSFYAITGLATRAGVPTNAVFGFVKAISKIERIWKPTHMVAVFDGGLDPRRRALLPEYKAQRPPMPNALKTQLALIEEYLELAAIAHVRLPDREADDVLATIAAQAPEEEVLILTSDKDFFQLVNEHISVVPPNHPDVALGPDAVFERTGVHPGQVVEWLALTGDASDNIAGVPGMGPRTAAGLLKKFGSLDGIWEHLPDVSSEKLRKALASCRDQVLRNVALVRLDTSIACSQGWRDAAVSRPDPGRLLPFFDRLEFHSLARNLRNQELF